MTARIGSAMHGIGAKRYQSRVNHHPAPNWQPTPTRLKAAPTAANPRAASAPRPNWQPTRPKAAPTAANPASTTTQRRTGSAMHGIRAETLPIPGVTGWG